MEKLLAIKEEDMIRFIGTELGICLKSSKTLTGLMIDIDKENVYLQISTKVIVVPRENIEYYETVGFNNAIDKTSAAHSYVISDKKEEPMDKTISVSVNGFLIKDMTFSPETDISSCSTDLFNFIIADKDVQRYIIGKVLSTAEYVIGKLNIITKEIPNKVQPNTFNFSVGTSTAAQTEYQSQSQILTSLSSRK